MDCSIQAPLSFTIFQSLLKFMYSESVILSNHLTLCHSLLFLPLIFTRIRVFSSESALHIRWPKYWSFSFSISPSNEYSGLISFRIYWFDLLALQGMLKSLQCHSSKASILLSFSLLYGPTHTSYMTTGKTIALTQFSHSVVSDSLWSHGLQLARLPCPSKTPRPSSNPCPSSWWCHPTISSSVVRYFGHLMGRTDSMEKTLIPGKIEGRRRRGWQRMR